jgi:hypothetical protein
MKISSHLFIHLWNFGRLHCFIKAAGALMIGGD